jgi:hypothetical protein
MKKPLTRFFLILLLVACAIFGTCKFDYDLRADGFVPVESIIGVPTGNVKNKEFTLSRSVYPSTATNKTIVWSISEDGETNATLNRNKLTATEAGTVTVRAVIKDGKAPGEDYAQEFEITIFEEYIAVNSIQDVPKNIPAGTVTLTGTVKPGNAVNKTIIWELKSAGETGATLDGDVLTTTAMGTLTVTAIVEYGAGPDTDFSQDFTITVAPLSVSSITGVASGCVVGDYTLFGIVSPQNATFKDITWEVKDDSRRTGAVINGNVLTTTSAGTVKVTAIVKDGIDFDYDYIQDFDIEVQDFFTPVNSIGGLPLGCLIGDYTLFARVDPAEATNRTIILELIDAGTTGAVMDGSVLTTASTGTLTVRALVRDGAEDGDYTQDFDIRITNTSVIHIAGKYYVSSENSWQACYLRNGEKMNLPVPERTVQSDASSIIVEGGKLYILGEYYNSNFSNLNSCYWVVENDHVQFVDLSELDAGTNAEKPSVSQIAVSGGDVYLAGRASKISPSGASSLHYWKNGEKIDMQDVPTSDIYKYPTFTGIAVNGEDVYITGYYDTSYMQRQPYYWDKDGTIHDLSYGNDFDYAGTTGISVHNGSVYIAGYQYTSGYPSNRNVCYWKDGTMVNLGSSNYYEHTGFTVQDGKVYMVASEGGIRYWMHDGVSDPIAGIIYAQESFNGSVVTIFEDVTYLLTIDGGSYLYCCVNGVKMPDHLGRNVLGNSIIVVRE